MTNKVQVPTVTFISWDALVKQHQDQTEIAEYEFSNNKKFYRNLQKTVVETPPETNRRISSAGNYRISSTGNYRVHQ